jgi:hypothetical protein
VNYRAIAHERYAIAGGTAGVASVPGLRDRASHRARRLAMGLGRHGRRRIAGGHGRHLADEGVVVNAFDPLTVVCAAVFIFAIVAIFGDDPRRPAL